MTTTDDTAPQLSNDEPVDSDAVEPDDLPTTPALAVKERHDPDAAWGTKTKKSGGNESFYGFHENTLVQVPQGNDAKDLEPRLIRRMELTPANEDVVAVSLGLIDRLPRPASDLDVDRHYSHKDVERWKDELAARGVNQHFDLRSDEHGFTEFEHMRWAAGWPHCPATSDVHGTIPRPAPGAPKNEKDDFRSKVADRAAYAFRRVITPDEQGTARWECPAMAGKVGCPLRAGTVDAALALGQPIIESPPDPESPDFPTCCAQRTVQVTPPPKVRKLMQPHYWGLRDWEYEYNKRTYVEGSYGNRKNPSTENMRRGHLRLTGLALVNIATALAATAYNLRMLRNWHERTGLGPEGNPMLEPEGEDFGFLRLTREQADILGLSFAHDDDSNA